MDRKTVFTKTAKGLMEVTGRTSLLARDQRDVLASIDGRATVGDLQRKLELNSDVGLMETLGRLVKDGFAREFVTSPTSLSPVSQFSGTRGDLDFSGVALTRGEAEKAREAAEAAAVGHRVREGLTRREREAEAKARREADEKAHRAAEEEARRAAQAAAQRAAEEKARREAEEKARREAEEKARREAEEKAHREAEERARQEAEAAARRAAEEKARREAEEQARREAEKRVRREAQEKTRREAEAKARREAEEKARRKAEEKERREAEARIKREAERGRREREAEAARAREEQKRVELAQARELEAELAERERALAAEHAAQAQAEEAQARALEAEQAVAQRAQTLDAQRARAREETEARVQARQAQHAAERAQAEARAAAREREGAREAAEVANRLWRIRHGKSRGRRVGLYVFVALLLAVGALYALQWVRIDPAPYAAWAERTLGVPVKVVTASWVFDPFPVLRLEDAHLGAAPGVRVAQVRARPDWLAWMSASPRFTHLELRGVEAPASALGALLHVAPTARIEGLSGVTLERVLLEVPGMRLPPMNGYLHFGGTPTRLALEDGAKSLTLDLLPHGDGSAVFELWANDAHTLAPALALADLRVRGKVSSTQADIAQFDARVHDGVVRGQGVLDWADGWRLQGGLEATSLSAAKFTPAVDGRLGGRADFAAHGSNFSALFAAFKLSGRFMVAQGRVSGFDLPRSLQAGAVVPGETPFDALTGQVRLEQGRVALRGMQLRAGTLTADANVDLSGNGALTGRVAAQLRIPAGVARGSYAVSGTPAGPVLAR